MPWQGIFSLQQSSNPVPRANFVLSLVFMAGTLALLVDAVAFGPYRCSHIEGTITVPFEECEKIQTETADCKVVWRDWDGCNSQIAALRTTSEVADPVNQCADSDAFLREWNDGANGGQDITCREEEPMTCQGRGLVEVCPSVYSCVGNAAGYASIWLTVCGVVHTLIASRSLRTRSRAEPGAIPNYLSEPELNERLVKETVNLRRELNEMKIALEQFVQKRASSAKEEVVKPSAVQKEV
jgi:hypothetical protein